MQTIKLTLAATGLFVLLGAIGFVALPRGAASADDGPTPALATPGPGVPQYEDLLARKLGITADQLKAAQKGAVEALIDEGVAAGKLTADQGTKLKSMDADPGRGRRLGRLKKAVSDIVDAAAKTIGISKDDLKSNLKQGKSLAQIAADHNVSRDQLKSDIMTSVQAQIQGAVASGKLSQQQADRLTAGLDGHLDKVIDRTSGKRKK